MDREGVPVKWQSHRRLGENFEFCPGVEVGGQVILAHIATHSIRGDNPLRRLTVASFMSAGSSMAPRWTALAP